MSASIFIESITFADGLKVDLNQNSIVVFVGSNNTGKSLALNEISMSLRSDGTFKKIVLDSITIKKDGTIEQLIDRLKHRESNGQFYFPSGQHHNAINKEQLVNGWQNFPNHSSSISSFLVKTLSTTERLSLIEPAQNLNFLEQLSIHPIQKLKEDEDLEREFSRFFQQAFGQEIIVNHGAGNVIPLHIGTRPEVTITKDRISKEYLNELKGLDLLHQQGDGMKSFAGVFLSLFVDNYCINFIDEPEAFLHPPQAKLIGQMMAKNLGNDKQIFISTHSEDVLKGLLDYGSTRLNIIRIRREGVKSHFNLLNNKEIETIWADSLLRHSNILDGLFHKQVVVCESDSDCRFFSAILTAISEADGTTAPDIHFVQAGGKHRFPVVINALKKLDVPIKVVGDIDVLNNEFPLRTMYESMGGDWSFIEKDFKIVKNAIDQKKPELETSDLRDSINSVFDKIESRVMSQDSLKSIRDLLKKASPWDEAKTAGKYYLNAGDATKSFNQLHAELEKKGILIIEVGEIEAFDKTVGGHGPKWVNAVLQKDLILSPDLETARDFIRKKLSR